MYGWIPIYLFPVLLWVGREELGPRGLVICLLLCVLLLIMALQFTCSGLIFLAGLTLLDAILVLIIFKRDITIM